MAHLSKGIERIYFIFSRKFEFVIFAEQLLDVSGKRRLVDIQKIFENAKAVLSSGYDIECSCFSHGLGTAVYVQLAENMMGMPLNRA